MPAQFTYEEDRTHGGLDNPSDIFPEAAPAAHVTVEGYPVQAVRAHMAAIEQEDNFEHVRAEIEALEARNRIIREAGKVQLESFLSAIAQLFDMLRHETEGSVMARLKLSMFEEQFALVDDWRKSVSGGTDWREAWAMRWLRANSRLNTIADPSSASAAVRS